MQKGNKTSPQVGTDRWQISFFTIEPQWVTEPNYGTDCWYLFLSMRQRAQVSNAKTAQDRTPYFPGTYSWYESIANIAQYRTPGRPRTLSWHRSIAFFKKLYEWRLSNAKTDSKMAQDWHAVPEHYHGVDRSQKICSIIWECMPKPRPRASQNEIMFIANLAFMPSQNIILVRLDGIFSGLESVHCKNGQSKFRSMASLIRSL